MIVSWNAYAHLSRDGVSWRPLLEQQTWSTVVVHWQNDGQQNEVISLFERIPIFRKFDNRFAYSFSLFMVTTYACKTGGISVVPYDRLNAYKLFRQ